VIWRLAPAVLTLAAGAASAEGGPSAESVARFAQAVAAAGCVVTEMNRKTVLAEAEMDETEAGVIAGWLVARGEADLTEAALRLTTGACA
jgi:hypothetical protein